MPRDNRYLAGIDRIRTGPAYIELREYNYDMLVPRYWYIAIGPSPINIELLFPANHRDRYQAFARFIKRFARKQRGYGEDRRWILREWCVRRDCLVAALMLVALDAKELTDALSCAENQKQFILLAHLEP